MMTPAPGREAGEYSLEGPGASFRARSQARRRCRRAIGTWPPCAPRGPGTVGFPEDVENAANHHNDSRNHKNKKIHTFSFRMI